MLNLTPSSDHQPAPETLVVPDDLRIWTVGEYFVIQRRERHFFWPFRLTTWTTIMVAGETRDEAWRALAAMCQQSEGRHPVSPA